MNLHRNLIRSAALAIAVSAALPALAETSVSVENGKHHYVFYSDKDIYYSPERHVYYWVEDGKWKSGPNLPQDEQDYVVRAKGVDIHLDTERPYERNDYVVSHYRDRDEGQRVAESDMPVGDRQVTTTTTTTTTKHHYVYYRDRDIYFAPDTRTYYWRNDGRWTSGTSLPPEYEPYVRSGGVSIELDTDRPYERNSYVIAHYGKRDHGDRDDDEDDDD